MTKETMKKIALFLLLTSPLLCNTPPKTTPPTKTNVKGQKEPDKKRTTEIQEALVVHGYTVEVTGKWDDQTRTCLRDIANVHKWQIDHVPDARVLGMLGLGSAHFNPAVLTDPPNRLDELQRKKLGEEPEE